jgi:hypothetical protein
VQAAHVLSTGRGGPLPLPRRRLRSLARTLPGLHDLLPSYRCVDEGATARRLTPSDVEALGGDGELARASLALHQRLAGYDAHGLRPVAGVEQPTMQSLVIADGVADGRYLTCEDDGAGGLSRVDRTGDSTVYRDSAEGRRSGVLRLPQTHGALAKSSEAIAHVCAEITERPLGPPMGAPAFGLDVPDVVVVGEELTITAVRLDDPAGASCRVVDAGSLAGVARPRLASRDGAVTAQTRLDRPGLFRVELKGGGYSAVTQLVMAVPPADPAEG